MMRAQVWQVLAEMVTAALVAGGVLSLIRFLEECFLSPGALTVAVHVRTQGELANLDILLENAKRHSIRTRGQVPVVLLDVRLATADPNGGYNLDEQVTHILKRYRARCYVIDLSDGINTDTPRQAMTPDRKE